MRTAPSGSAMDPIRAALPAPRRWRASCRRPAGRGAGQPRRGSPRSSRRGVRARNAWRRLVVCEPAAESAWPPAPRRVARASAPACATGLRKLGPAVQLEEDPTQLAARRRQPVATAISALEDTRGLQLAHSLGEHRGADAGPAAKLGEAEGIAAELPDDPQRPAPAQQVERLEEGFRGHYFDFRIK